MIPLSVPLIQGNEWKYIKECLDTGWVSSAGKYVELFEKKVCEYNGSKYAVACVNGTAALQVSLRLAGVKAGDEVIVPTLTFIATVNAVKYLAAEPVFMDADDYYNINVAKIAGFLKDETRFKNGYTINKLTGRRIAAVIPVHVFGNASDLDPLVEICREQNIKVVEDATESLGTQYTKGRFAKKHCGTVGSLGCLSFNGNKIITSGGGGMILTDNSEIAEKARYLINQAKDEDAQYIHNEIGYNFRLSNIQAAMGVAQLEQLPKFLRTKKDTYSMYREKVNAIPGLQIADVPGYADNNHWMIAMQIDKDIYGKSREELMAHLSQRGIEIRPVWQLSHMQAPYRNCQHYKIARAFELLEKTLNTPCSANITKDQIDKVIECLANA